MPERHPGFLPLYRCYGFNLASDTTFTAPLLLANGTPDLTFALSDMAGPAIESRRTDPVYQSQTRLDSGESALSVLRAREYDILRFTEVSDFYLWPDRIACHLLDPAYDFTVEIQLLGLVFSVWLECRGMPALHASAVVVDDGVVVFLAGNRGGKSSLAASMLQRGHALLSDDVVALERQDGQVWGRPSFPQMRLWPTEADYFLGSHEQLPLAHPRYTKRRVTVGPTSFGRFCDRSLPLLAIYLPQQVENTAIEVGSAPQAQSLIELVRHSFAAHLAEAMGLRAPRFRFFTELLREVPVRHLVYPPGFEHLSDVCDAVVDDVAALPR